MPGKSHGPRSLVGYNPWGHKESDTTEQFLCAEAQISNGLLQGQGLWLQQTWEVQYVSPTTKPLSKQPTNGRTIIPKKFLHCCESSKAHNTFPNLGIQAKDWESKVRCCKEQYYIGIWSGRSMNQGDPWKETYNEPSVSCSGMSYSL